MFVIMDINNGYFFHKKGKIILFETQEEAQAVLQGFYQYSVQRLLQTAGPRGIFELQQVMSSLQVVIKNFEQEPECGVILFREII